MTRKRTEHHAPAVRFKPDRRRFRWCEAIGHHHFREGEFFCCLCGATTCEDDL